MSAVFVKLENRAAKIVVPTYRSAGDLCRLRVVESPWNVGDGSPY